MGTGALYMFVSALYRSIRRPYVVGGLGMLAGYLTSMATALPRYDDPQFRRFLRQYQRACLLFGKRRVTDRMHAQLRGVPNADN
jgi:hypothetical protein